MSNNYISKDSEAKIKKFLNAYKELCDKYDVELMSAPQLVPSGERGFNLSSVIVPIDKAQGGVKSPVAETVGDVLK